MCQNSSNRLHTVEQAALKIADNLSTISREECPPGFKIHILRDETDTPVSKNRLSPANMGTATCRDHITMEGHVRIATIGCIEPIHGNVRGCCTNP